MIRCYPRLQRGGGAARGAGARDDPGPAALVLPAVAPAARRQHSPRQEASARVGLRLQGHRHQAQPLGPAQRRAPLLRRRRGGALRPRGERPTALRRTHRGHHLYGGRC